MAADEPIDGGTGSGERDSVHARKTLDRHGHGFHYAVIKALQKMRSGWRFEAAEFPVDLNGVALHIDIVLRTQRAMMAIECKRVNRALGAWCFARSALVSTSHGGAHQVSLERVFISDGARPRLMVERPADDSIGTEHQYHVAQEVKTDEKGDGHGGRSAIAEAVSQAVRGANGLVEAFAAAQNPLELMQSRHLCLVPVVVTTARLLVLTTDLAEADLATGRLPQAAKVESRPWIWFRMMMSSGIRHRVPTSQSEAMAPYSLGPSSLGGLADRDYARSVGIVSVEGLAEFLEAARLHTGDRF